MGLRPDPATASRKNAAGACFAGCCRSTRHAQLRGEIIASQSMRTNILRFSISYTTVVGGVVGVVWGFALDVAVVDALVVGLVVGALIGTVLGLIGRALSMRGGIEQAQDAAYMTGMRIGVFGVLGLGLGVVVWIVRLVFF